MPWNTHRQEQHKVKHAKRNACNVPPSEISIINITLHNLNLFCTKTVKSLRPRLGISTHNDEVESSNYRRYKRHWGRIWNLTTQTNFRGGLGRIFIHSHSSVCVWVCPLGNNNRQNGLYTVWFPCGSLGYMFGLFPNLPILAADDCEHAGLTNHWTS